MCIKVVFDMIGDNIYNVQFYFVSFLNILIYKKKLFWLLMPVHLLIQLAISSMCGITLRGKLNKRI